MFEVSVRKSFSAAHLISNIGGYCEHLHGHNFIVELVVGGETLNGEGLLVDFRDLKKALEEILMSLDHKYLNETEAFSEQSPSAENIARWIFDAAVPRLAESKVVVRRVDVWESENAKASFWR